MAVRGNPFRPRSGSGDARDCRDHDRRDRHRRRPGRTGSRRQGAAELQRARPGRRRPGPERPRHVRRLTRRGLELERRRNRRQLRRRPPDGDRGGRPAGLVHGRRRGCRDRLRRRSRRTDHQPQPGRSTTSSTERRAVDYAVSKGACSLRRSATATEAGTGRISGRAPAARRLARRRRTRSLGRCVDEVGRTRVVPTRARTSPSQRPATPSSAPSPPPPPSRAIRASAFRARPQGSTATPAARLCGSAGGRCRGVVGRRTRAFGQGGRSDSEAHGPGGRKVEPQLGYGVLDVAGAVAQARVPAPLERAQASTRSI